jgi:uncharacterized protein DUF4301
VTFTDRQKSQLRARGISEDEARRQLDVLGRPPAFARLVRACTLGDGVDTVPDDARERLILLHDQAAAQGRCVKFVPASGAATRMFQDLVAGRGADEFLAAVDSFAFVDDLRAELAFRGYDLDVLRGAGDTRDVVEALLHDEGLGYAAKAKGLIPFHRSTDGPRTAFEEHLGEAAATVRDGEQRARLHFTIAPEHLGPFQEHAARVLPACEKRLGTRFQVEFSVQQGSTDTVAATLSGEPFTTEAGDLVLRPSGHGALLQNLAELGADVVFVKNIDNVQPDALRADTVRWKKILGGLLVDLQREVFVHVARLRSAVVPPEWVDEAGEFARARFGTDVPAGGPVERRRAELLAELDRPLRVCGVVRNTGEPGGGPFWVRGAAGRTARQIVESSQIDPASEEQQTLVRTSTHFNPVDLVLGVRDAAGRPFDLQAFVDPSASIVTRKSHAGVDLLALERPGLWNGGMAGWLTVFVEVPVTTFTPVKTVMDLLRAEHRG